MTIEPSSILTKEDMEKERTPEELSLWWDEKEKQFRSTKETLHYALLKKGLSGKCVDEMLPLKLLAENLYSGRSDIGCILNFGNDNFDAIIRDHSTSPPSDVRIEFTLAIDGRNDYLFRKYFIEHEHEPIVLPSIFLSTGTEKSGHKIDIADDLISYDNLLVDTFCLIRERALNKCNKRYGKDYILVIIIDDFICPAYDHKEGIEALTKFAEDNLINLPLDFRELCILGYSGKTFLRFQLG